MRHFEDTFCWLITGYSPLDLCGPPLPNNFSMSLSQQFVVIGTFKNCCDRDIHNKKKLLWMTLSQQCGARDMHNNCCGCVMPKLLWMGYSQQSYIRLIWKKCILKLCYHDIEKNWNLDIMTTTISEGNFSDTYQFVGKMKVTSVWAEVLKKTLMRMI